MVDGIVSGVRHFQCALIMNLIDLEAEVSNVRPVLDVTYDIQI